MERYLKTLRTFFILDQKRSSVVSSLLQMMYVKLYSDDRSACVQLNCRGAGTGIARPAIYRGWVYREAICAM